MASSTSIRAGIAQGNWADAAMQGGDLGLSCPLALEDLCDLIIHEDEVLGEALCGGSPQACWTAEPEQAAAGHFLGARNHSSSSLHSHQSVAVSMGRLDSSQPSLKPWPPCTLSACAARCRMRTLSLHV